MDSICLNFLPRGVYVREHKRTDAVDHNGRYVFRWMSEQRYTDYLTYIRIMVYTILLYHGFYTEILLSSQ